MASFQHAAIVALFRLTRRKRRYASGEALLASARKRRKKNRQQPPLALDGVVVTRDDSVGFPVFTVAPPGGASRVGMYVHGGAYVNDLQRQHWTFIAETVRRTQTALM